MAFFIPRSVSLGRTMGNKEVNVRGFPSCIHFKRVNKQMQFVVSSRQLRVVARGLMQ